MRALNYLLSLPLACALAAAELATPISKTAPKLTPSASDPMVAQITSLILQQSHYLKLPLNDEVSSKFFDRYINALDPQHIYFLQSDLKEFENYRTTLDDLTKSGDTSPANKIFLRFFERFKQQVTHAEALLKSEKLVFNTEERYNPVRRNLPFPADLAEQDKFWRDRLRYEYLQEKLNIEPAEAVAKFVEGKLGGQKGKATFQTRDKAGKEKMDEVDWIKTPSADAIAKSLESRMSKERAEQVGKLIAGNIGKKKPAEIAALVKDKLEREKNDEVISIISRRYSRIMRSLTQFDSDDVFERYLTSLMHVYDPHSDYMGKSSMDNFNMSMRLSLFGIGAILGSEDGYCKISSLMANGPAEKSKNLKAGDRIVAVAQGAATPVDVVDEKLNKIVEMIRGPKGTEVRLTVIPGDAPDPSMRKVVTIIRDEIKLEDQEAKAKVYEVPAGNNKTVRMGYIDLPSFYADMESRDKNHKSTTTDVAKLVKKLKEENIGGLILDLRRNGGGSLEEAINLTGLFVKQGPVVQVRDTLGRTRVDADKDDSILYEGPLIVMTSRGSASASEILAGALQDYDRALIVGDSSTHGKGTVQTLVGLGDVLRDRGVNLTNNPGALKLTIQKFYRASGGSTQLKGITPDLVLPSVANFAEVGEASLENPLAWDTIPSAKFEKVNQVQQFLPELRKRSDTRIAKSTDFAYVNKDIELFKKALADRSVSLNEAQRLKEKQEAKERSEARQKELKARGESKEKIYEFGLKDVDKPGLPAPLSASKTNAVVAAGPGQPRSTALDDPDDLGELAPAGPTHLDLYLDETRQILADLIELSRQHPSLAGSQPKPAKNP